MSEPEIKLKTSANPSNQVYRIDVALSDLVHHQKIKILLAELLTKVIKTALMEKYSQVQAIVDEVILSQETEEMVKNAIRNEVQKMAAQAAKEMFEGK